MDCDSKDYSWAWVTEDRPLQEGPCELVYAFMQPYVANDKVTIYNGTNTTGNIVTVMQGAYDYGAASAAGQSVPFSPPVPVYCDAGLYVDIGETNTRLFVMWRSRR